MLLTASECWSTFPFYSAVHGSSLSRNYLVCRALHCCLQFSLQFVPSFCVACFRVLIVLQLRVFSQEDRRANQLCCVSSSLCIPILDLAPLQTEIFRDFPCVCAPEFLNLTNSCTRQKLTSSSIVFALAFALVVGM